MGLNKKLIEYATSSNDSNHYPLDDHIAFWTRRYDREIHKIDVKVKKTKKEPDFFS